MRHGEYRPDIDGLRAIAVLSVLAFHVESDWLPGGFAGVDIFFVISGYLITTILRREILAGRFSLKDFYLRRARRIFPPLFLVIAVSLAAGCALLLPDDLKELAKSARYALLFYSNYHFANEQDYFAPDTEQMPLLHTWSLAVEEQFYLIWPLTLFVILRRARGAGLWLIGAVTMASFAVATVRALDPVSEAAAYFHLSGRFGELLVGAWLACIPQVTRWASAAAGVGMALVVGSVMLLGSVDIFPGYNAIWPCLGTALLIHAGSHGPRNAVSRMLGTAPFVYVGKLSYSLYLWHWPVLAFVRYRTDSGELGNVAIAASLMLILVLSWLSWRFVENPLRHARFSPRATATGYFLAPVLVLFIFASAIRSTDGYLGNDASRQYYSIESDSLVCHNRLKESCGIGDGTASPFFLLAGDSHAAHLTTYMDRYARHHAIAGTAVSADGCGLFSVDDFSHMGDGERKKDCQAASAYVQANMAEHDVLVLSTMWSDRLEEDGFEAGLLHALERSRKLGMTVLLLAQMPAFERNVARLHFIGRGSENRVDERFRKANERLQAIADRFDNVRYVNLFSFVADWRSGLSDGKPLYKDEDHLNLYGQHKLFESTRDIRWLLPDSRVAAQSTGRAVAE